MKSDARARFTLRIPRELFQRIEEEAQKNYVSVNSQILMILQAWLREQEEKKEG